MLNIHTRYKKTYLVGSLGIAVRLDLRRFLLKRFIKRYSAYGSTDLVCDGNFATGDNEIEGSRKTSI
jgi:hypothetical protein